MDVRVDGWAWLPKSELTPDQIVNMERMLTVHPQKIGDYPGEEPQPIPLYEHGNGEFGVPREFFFSNRRATHRIDMQVTEGSDDWWPAEFVGTLRPEQTTAMNEVVAMFRAGRLGGIIQAKPGWGKTVCALAIAAELGLPTLVVVHKEFLMDQWAERIEKFLPAAKIGRVQQDECDFLGKTVVMGMVHSLGGSQPYPDALWNWPGLVIVDESVGECATVLTREGWRTIGSLVESDGEVEALAFDERRGVFEWKPVTRRWRHTPRSPMLRITHEGGVLECTANHEVLTPLGYMKAQELVPGVDCVVCVEHPSGAEGVSRGGEGGSGFHSSASRVLRIEEIETPEFVYDLTVEDHHNFVVDGVVTHNCHRIGARTWAPVPPRFMAKYRLGFTATPRRKDGADDVFWQHIGPIVFAGKEERLRPVIKRVWTKFKLVKTDRFNPHLAPKALITRFLVKSRYRNDLIIDQLIAALEAGRKILVLSERLQHLLDLESQLRRLWPAMLGDVSIGQYVGGRSKVQLERSSKARVIFATIQYAAEGLDIPALDTLFLTTPMSDVEQAVGRIQRPHGDKKPPIVVDFRDDAIPMFEAMGRKRDKFYTRVT